MHLVIADDHTLVLDTIEAYLKALQPGIRLQRGADFDEALAQTTKFKDIDLVVLDLNMPGMNGLEGLKRMKEHFPKMPVALLSGQFDPNLARKALNAGAAGFIPKSIPANAMIKALELILSGEVFVPAVVLADDFQNRSSGSSGHFATENPLSQLTPREVEVLSYLAEGSANKKIASRLGVKEVTVAFHLKSIFRKLEVTSRTEAITSALKLGLNVG